MKSGVSRSENLTIWQGCVLVHCLAGRFKSYTICIHVWKWSFWAFFVATM